jgi:hypothetical protein
MKSLKQFINENTMNKHKEGTYVSVILDKPSQDILFSWVKENNITNAADPEQYHSTVIHSKTPCPDAIDYDLGLPINASISSFKLFDTQTGGKCLVGIVNSSILENHHNVLVNDFGASHNFLEYHPHITLSYDYTGDIPKEIPKFRLTYNKSDAKPLDPTFVPKKVDIWP